MLTDEWQRAVKIAEQMRAEMRANRSSFADVLCPSCFHRGSDVKAVVDALLAAADAGGRALLAKE